MKERFRNLGCLYTMMHTANDNTGTTATTMAPVSVEHGTQVVENLERQDMLEYPSCLLFLRGKFRLWKKKRP